LPARSDAIENTILQNFKEILIFLKSSFDEGIFEITLSSSLTKHEEFTLLTSFNTVKKMDFS
jgi:hypothetical protein